MHSGYRCWIRRLAARCASVHTVNTLADYFIPSPPLPLRQLGVGVLEGYDAAVHKARLFNSNMLSDNIFDRLNFSNVFTETSCWRRESMI